MSGYAIITPSYAGDFERCRLLCASVDRFVSGLSTHYLMVEEADVAQFSALEGPRRRVVSDADILPRWLKPVANPLPVGPRRLWLSHKGRPMRGWHVQQLRKLALPQFASEDVALICDSDVVFVRPFDLASLRSEKGLRFYRKPEGITATMTELGHVDWCRMAAKVLDLPPPRFPHADYVENLIIFERRHVEGLQARIAAVTGRDWQGELVRWPSFSEAMLYGLYVDEVAGGEGMDPTPRPLARTCWGGDRLGEADILRFCDELAPDQVAIGLQSFIAVEPEALWRLLEQRASAPLGQPVADER